MADQRLIVAIGRAERALSRIDAAGTRAATWAVDMVKRTDYDGLDARHRKLRKASTETLSALDRLIGVEPRG
jgi:hypothetical protein